MQHAAHFWHARLQAPDFVWTISLQTWQVTSARPFQLEKPQRTALLLRTFQQTCSCR